MRINAMMNLPKRKPQYVIDNEARFFYNQFKKELGNCMTKGKAEELLKKTIDEKKQYLKASVSINNFTKTFRERLNDACQERIDSIRSNKRVTARQQEERSSRATKRRVDKMRANAEKNTQERIEQQKIDEAKGTKKEYYKKATPSNVERWISIAKKLMSSSVEKVYVRQERSSHQALREDARSMKENAAARAKAFGINAQERLFSQTGTRLNPNEALKKLRREAGG